MSELRWVQRFSNFRKPLSQLTNAVSLYDDSAPNIIKEGVLQRFEFTHELAWKVMKDYLVHEGHQNITGSRSASRQAFAVGLIEGDGQVWMNMIESRNRTVHTYEERILQDEFRKVTKQYAPALAAFDKIMVALAADASGSSAVGQT
jgi:nucleotidyltransferase substrate binding protein (TIGR01987 family)